MSKERILSYNLSKALSVEELKDVSAAGWTSYMTGGGGWDPHSGVEGHIDGNIDW